MKACRFPDELTILLSVTGYFPARNQKYRRKGGDIMKNRMQRWVSLLQDGRWLVKSYAIYHLQKMFRTRSDRKALRRLLKAKQL